MPEAMEFFDFERINRLKHDIGDVFIRWFGGWDKALPVMRDVEGVHRTEPIEMSHHAFKCGRRTGGHVEKENGCSGAFTISIVDLPIFCIHICFTGWHRARLLTSCIARGDWLDAPPLQVLILFGALSRRQHY